MRTAEKQVKNADSAGECPGPAQDWEMTKRLSTMGSCRSYEKGVEELVAWVSFEVLQQMEAMK